MESTRRSAETPRATPMIAIQVITESVRPFFERSCLRPILKAYAMRGRSAYHVRARSSSGMRHRAWIDDRIKILGADEVELERGLAEARAIFMRALGDRCRGVITDLRREGRHEHQRILKE